MSSQTSTPLDDEDDSGDMFMIVIFLLVMWLILFFYGASIRGITKLIERNALDQHQAPASVVYVGWSALNALTGGILGFVLNLFMQDPFEGVPVFRQDKAMGLTHGAHDEHFK